MSHDPPRLLDQSGDEFERALLGSAALDVGSDRVRAACVAAMAAGAVMGTAATAQAAGVSAKAGSVLFAKWLAVGTTVGVVATTAAVAIRPSAPSAPTVPAPRSVEPATAVAPARPRARRPAPQEVEAPAPSTPPPSAVPAPAQSSLAEELRLLDQARAALQQDRPVDALAALGRRDRAHPQGALGPEATVLRVQALLAAGDRNGAETTGRRWLEHHPSGAHSRRIRDLLGLHNP